MDLRSKKLGLEYPIARSRTVISQKDVGLFFSVYNGQKYINVYVNEIMVGKKFGEFIKTRVMYSSKKKK